MAAGDPTVVSLSGVVTASFGRNKAFEEPESHDVAAHKCSGE
jgi:hypothetical protein